MRILVTGGCGYIGTHAVLELMKSGFEVVILDNFSNSQPEVLKYIEKISGIKPIFYEGDVQNETLLHKIFGEQEINAVIHFAGFKAVGESVTKPLMYYENNLFSTIILLKVMEKFQIYNFVFSSSATVYGKPKKLPIKEDSELKTTNPYGTTKLMIEQILRDLSGSNSKWSIAILRYFNPIGAHESGLLGENPNGTPNNLMPYIVKVATGELKELNIFGNDYETHDGTGVRDYIHVVDLAKGHVCAIKYVLNNNGIDAFNLGTGIGYSVLEIVKTFELVNNVAIPYLIAPRRDGDIAECYADATYAFKKLNWQAQKDIQAMCKDSYSYVKKNKSF